MFILTTIKFLSKLKLYKNKETKPANKRIHQIEDLKDAILQKRNSAQTGLHCVRLYKSVFLFKKVL